MTLPLPRVFPPGLPCHSEYPEAKATLADPLGDHEALIRQLRADLATTIGKHNDAGTSDFLTGLMEKHEKMAWMLRGFAG